MDVDAIVAALGISQMQVVSGKSHTWRATVQFDWLFIHSYASYLVWLSDVDPLNSYRIHVQGEGRKSLVNGSGIVHLQALGMNTRLMWQAETQLAANLSLVGKPLVQQTIKVLSHTFFTRLEAQITQSQVQLRHAPQNLV